MNVNTQNHINLTTIRTEEKGFIDVSEPFQSVRRKELIKEKCYTSSNNA